MGPDIHVRLRRRWTTPQQNVQKETTCHDFEKMIRCRLLEMGAPFGGNISCPRLSPDCSERPHLQETPSLSSARYGKRGRAAKGPPNLQRAPPLQRLRAFCND